MKKHYDLTGADALTHYYKFISIALAVLSTTRFSTASPSPRLRWALLYCIRTVPRVR